jgi:hypothetical protein
MRHRPNELAREAIELLIAHGVTPAVSNGGKHIKIAFMAGCRRHVFMVSHRPTGSRTRANSRAALRRLLQQVEAMEDRPR